MADRKTVVKAHFSTKFKVDFLKTKALKKPLFIFFVLLLTGCAGLVHKSGEALNGNAFAEKTFAQYRSTGTGNDTTVEIKELKLKSGENILEISSSAWPSFVLRGTEPDIDGGFNFSEARFLSSHAHGWNEFTLDLLGGAVFSVSGGFIGRLRIPGEVDRVQISSGKIRLKSNRYSGTSALTPLRNRRERILALIEWMDLQAGEPGETDVPVNQLVFTDQNAFEDHWKPILFPELALKRNKPPEYIEENAEWAEADSVKWNLTYTEYLFPEELREYRNSGALLRDWDEALPWIHMEYSWEYVINSLNEINFLLVK